MTSDSAIQRAVERELSSDPRTNAGKIGSAVEHGVVTLTGNVDLYPEKWSAARAAQRVAGVKAVANDIRFRRVPGTTDTGIAKAVAKAVRWSAPLPTDRIMVKVEDRWVTLTGQVALDSQRRATERRVRRVPGIEEIINCITLTPHPQGEVTKGKIRASLRRPAPRHCHTDHPRQAAVRLLFGNPKMSTGR